MGFFDSLLNSFGFGSSNGSGNNGFVMSWLDSAVQAGLDSLGLSQHGRDQAYNRELYFDALNAQQAFQREQTANQQDFTREMYGQQWKDMLSKYPELQQRLNNQNFNLWRQQFNNQTKWQEQMYKKYQTPQAVAQANSVAGLNPAALNGVNNGVGSVSVGSASAAQPPQISPTPFSSPASPMGIPQGLSGKGSSIAQVGSFLRDLAEAKKLGKESNRYDEITDAMIEKLYKEGESHEALAAYNGARTIIERALGKEFKKSEIEKNLRMAMYYGQMEQTEKAQEELNKASSWLVNSKNQVILEQLPFIQDNINAINDYLDSMSYRNRAEGGLAYAKQLTEQDLRQMYRQQGGLFQELKFLRHTDRIEQYATMPDRITESINRAEQSGLISQKMAEELRTAQKNNDWYDVREGFDMMYKGMNTYYHGRFSDARDVQNAIDADWNDFQKDHYGDTNEMYEETYTNNRGHKVRQTYSRRRSPLPR